MTDRDRLIEVLRNCIEENVGVNDSNVSFEVDYENIADHLLANGVIVSPCKVGDTVYFYKAELEEICISKVVEIEISYFTPSRPIWITVQYESKMIGRQQVKMAETVFNLLCYKTKKQAEEKLKELKNVEDAINSLEVAKEEREGK